MTFSTIPSSVFLIGCFFRTIFTAKCPVQNHTNEICSEVCSDSDMICYSDLDGITDGKGHCCGKLDEFCTATNLITFHTLSKNGFSHKYTRSLASAYYEDPVTKAACPYPYFFGIQKLKFLPVDFSTTRKIPLNTCVINADCGDDEFCGASMNPSFGEKAMDNLGRGAAHRFCYKNIPLKEKLSVALISTDKNLPVCSEHIHCKDNNKLCLLFGSGNTILNEQLVGFNGLCAFAEVCENPGGLTSNIGVLKRIPIFPKFSFCEKDNDCNTVTEYDRNIYDGKCTPILNVRTEKKVCCFEPKKCGDGLRAIPIKKCSNSSECSSTGDQKCSGGYCCTDTNNMMCPDKSTPLFLEPLCDVANIKGCKCHKGHCCSGLKIENGEVELGAETYVTNVKCVEGKIPSKFHYAFCYNNKVVIVGMDVVMSKLTSENYKSCKKNSECSKDMSSMCIHIISGENFCVPNPFLSDLNKSRTVIDSKTEHLDSQFIAKYTNMIIFIIAGIVGVIIFLFVLFIIYKKFKSASNKKNMKTRTMRTTQELSNDAKNEKDEPSSSNKSVIAKNSATHTVLNTDSLSQLNMETRM